MKNTVTYYEIIVYPDGNTETYRAKGYLSTQRERVELLLSDGIVERPGAVGGLLVCLYASNERQAHEHAVSMILGWVRRYGNAHG